MPTPSDDVLVDRARDGDDTAFARLVDRYESQVAAVIVGMLGDGPEAQDVGQETFVRFYRALDQFRGDASVGTYLTRIAINQALKAIKRRQRWYQRFLPRDDAPPDAEPTGNLSDDMDATERQAQVHAALQRIDAKHRAVVVLRILQGYSTRETASLLDVPEGTVMSRLSRALDKLEPLLASVVATEA
jgi:RNA polymerase sigma-70 factor (ECF subfamily)